MVKRSMAEQTKKRFSDWRYIATFVSFVAFLVLIYALKDEIKAVFETVGQINYWFLLLMVPVQFINYHSYARIYQRFYEVLGKKIKYWSLMRVNLELNFVNNIFPSGGVSGISYYGLRMRNFGVSTPKATLAQFMKFMLLFVSFQVLLVFGVIALATKGKAGGLTLIAAASMATLLIVGTVFVAYVISKQSRINAFVTPFSKSINRLGSFFRRSDKDLIDKTSLEKALGELHENYQIIRANWRDMRRPLFYALIANITEVLAIYVVYLAFGSAVNIGAVIIAYALANFAGFISVLPGGIGIFEAIMTTVLVASGVPASLSIPVTIMYRVLNSAIQLPAGYFFYHRALPKLGQYKDA